MPSFTNMAEISPVTKLIPSDEESEDLKALMKQLEAVKAKNEKIVKKKKEWEEVKCLKEAEEEKERQEAKAKWKADEAEAKQVADKAEAKRNADKAMAEQFHKATEAHKRNVSAAQSFMVLAY